MASPTESIGHLITQDGSMLKNALLGVLLVLGILFSTWAWFAAPCGMYRYTSVKDIPARCLMHR